jgi:disulfide bond formation protein DsbB
MIGNTIAALEAKYPIPSTRLSYFLLSLGCAAMIGVALFMEHQMNLEPCPLCILQRVGVIAVGIVALIAAAHHPLKVGNQIYGGLVMFCAAAGGGVSMRQLWLQSLPEDEVPACGASLDYMLDVFPLTDVLSMVLTGDGTCAEVVFSFLGISIPGWTLIGYLALIFIGLFQVLRQR